MVLFCSKVRRLNRAENKKSRMSSTQCCRYCHQIFQPSVYRPQQRVCGEPDCQRRRRSDYHRERIRNDSAYAEDVRASQKKWRQANRDYWKQYRQQHPEAAERNRNHQRQRDQKRRLLNLAKNNLALDLKHEASEVWLVGPGVNVFSLNVCSSYPQSIWIIAIASMRSCTRISACVSMVTAIVSRRAMWAISSQ
jgi:tRNA(Leu) C34 or U34 (ribose-2'-O)-methylase TrmL